MENRNQNTKAIVEGGMISALTVFLTLFLIFTGLVSVLAICVIPIPITILYLRQNFKISLITVLVNTIIVSLLYNPIEAAANTMVFGLVGLAFGFCLKKKYSVGKIISILGIVFSIAFFINSAIYLELITNQGLKDSINDMLKQYNKMRGNQGLNVSTEFMMKLVPGLIIIIGYITAYVNYLFTKVVLKRLKYKMEDMIPFTKLYVPNRIGAFIVIMFLLGTILSIKKVIIGEYLVSSSELVLLIALTIQGAAVVSYFLINKYNITKSVVIMIIVVSLFLQVVLVYVIMGFLDLFIDFRKVDPNRIFRK